MRNPIRSWIGLLILVFVTSLILLSVPSASAQAPGGVWFARAGAGGDGTSAASPVGSTAALDSLTAPGDVIFLLPSEAPLNGGLALKTGQALIGLSEAGRKPVITNTDSTRNGGNGIVLDQDNRIWNVRIENTYASGVLGTGVSGTRMDGVEISGANGSGSSTAAGIRAMGGPVPHGGIVFIATGPDVSVENRVDGSEVVDAAGVGIGALAFGAAQSRLIVSGTRVEGGTLVGFSDAGIAALAEGPSSAVRLELTDSAVRGRVSRAGRNVVVLASADASARARIERSHVSESGQDGVIGVAALIPARVSIEISDSVIEKAAQINVEGTILNLPAFDASRTQETSVAIEVDGSIIREAGAFGEFPGDAFNVWVGSSASAQQFDPSAQVPFPSGSYRLAVRNSRIEGARDYGFGIGSDAARWGIAPEGSTFEVVLHENDIAANGTAEIVVRAPQARVDARRNCWSTPDGLPEERLVLEETAERSHVDLAEPLSSCATPKPQ